MELPINYQENYWLPYYDIVSYDTAMVYGNYEAYDTATIIYNDYCD